MFKKIAAVEIITNDLAKSLEFYTDVLGFEHRKTHRIEHTSQGAPLNIVWLDLGPTALQLISWEGITVPPPQRSVRARATA